MKRLCLELGGKSANVVLPDADLEKAARWNIQRAFFNAGQSCHAPSRMLVAREPARAVAAFLVDEATASTSATRWTPRRPWAPSSATRRQRRSGNSSRAALDEGARLLTGGTERPNGLDRGYFVQPTVFTDVTPEMTIAQEEVFGPVLAVIPYADEDEAVRIANDSLYGLGGYVFGGQRERARDVVNRLRAGRVSFNGAPTDSYSPMGGYKQSGVGRSMGRFGFEEYLEVKSVYGFEDEARALPRSSAEDAADTVRLKVLRGR